jgi:hypothetical protein
MVRASDDGNQKIRKFSRKLRLEMMEDLKTTNN